MVIVKPHFKMTLYITQCNFEMWFHYKQSWKNMKDSLNSFVQLEQFEQLDTVNTWNSLNTWIL